jgi:hypothetical protein
VSTQTTIQLCRQTSKSIRNAIKAHDAFPSIGSLATDRISIWRQTAADAAINLDSAADLLTAASVMPDEFVETQAFIAANGATPGESVLDFVKSQVNEVRRYEQIVEAQKNDIAELLSKTDVSEARDTIVDEIERMHSDVARRNNKVEFDVTRIGERLSSTEERIVARIESLAASSRIDHFINVAAWAALTTWMLFK